MTTAALMPSSGDPLLARYWCNNYERVWRGEVDELHVLVNGGSGGSIYREHGAIVTEMGQIGHGQALDRLVGSINADAVVLLEDDAFVRHPGEIASRLDRILSGETDVIGCPRGGMSPVLEQAALAKWGPVEGPDTSSGHGLWPCFLFARPADLRAVADMRFESITWHPGEYIAGLDYRVTEDVTTDTMTLMAYQLRDRLRITPEVQYKEMWQKDYAVMSARTGEPPWFHAGGMSCNEAQYARPDIGMDNNEGRDWAHRFWWWRRVGHEFRSHWERAGLDPDYWNPIIEPWINWENG